MEITDYTKKSLSASIAINDAWPSLQDRYLATGALPTMLRAYMRRILVGAFLDLREAAGYLVVAPWEW